MKHSLLIALFLTIMSLPAFAQVKDEDKTCQTDDDCALYATSCNGCCPYQDMAHVGAVNKSKTKSYDTCTQEHFQSCGVPECGLRPAPYPDTQCVKGVCTLYLHPAPGQPDTVEGTVTQSPSSVPSPPNTARPNEATPEAPKAQ